MLRGKREQEWHSLCEPTRARLERVNGKTTRRDAVQAARNLIGQGVEGVTIKDENGRVYVPAEFDAFLNGE
jgi:hypothetical protein